MSDPDTHNALQFIAMAKPGSEVLPQEVALVEVGLQDEVALLRDPG